MNRSESKFKNTAEKMDNALLAIINEKDFQDINVAEICEKAGVSRSTFYDHYQNTYDLLKETQNMIMKNFHKSFNEAGITFPDISKLDKNDLYFISPKYLVPYLEYVKKNKRIFRTYLTHLATFEPEDAFDDLFKYVLKPVFMRMGVMDNSIMQYMSKFFLSGITAIVNEWVNNDCKDDILFIVEIITACIKAAQ